MKSETIQHLSLTVEPGALSFFALLLPGVRRAANSGYFARDYAGDEPMANLPAVLNTIHIQATVVTKIIK